MLFNYDEEADDFDDEPQDLSLDGEDDANFDAEFSNDLSDGEEPPEAMEKQNDASNESVSYERIAETLKEDKLEEGSSPPTLVEPQGALFRLYEQNNNAYRDAVTAYFEKKNYQQAIEKFEEAITDASQRAAHDLTEDQAREIIAKSMYWQAEACVKMQNLQQAVGIFKALIQNYPGHYLTLAAERRAGELNAEDLIDAKES